MSLPVAWPLLAFIVVPGVFAWWSGRRLVRRPDDPALAERLLARTQHTQRVTVLSCVCMAFGAGPYYWLAGLALIVGLWIGDYPSRRVLLDERWGPATYLLWQLRFSIAWLGFWFALLLAPTAIQAADIWRWPAAIALALLLGLWAARSTQMFLWLVRARPRLWRVDWQPILDRSRATRPRLFEMPVPGGRFVNAFAFPSTRVPSVVFTVPALELLSAREQAAVFAHEGGHLEHYTSGRCRLVSAVVYGRAAGAPSSSTARRIRASRAGCTRFAAWPRFPSCRSTTRSSSRRRARRRSWSSTATAWPGWRRATPRIAIPSCCARPRARGGRRRTTSWSSCACVPSGGAAPRSSRAIAAARRVPCASRRARSRRCSASSTPSSPCSRTI